MSDTITSAGTVGSYTPPTLTNAGTVTTPGTTWAATRYDRQPLPAADYSSADPEPKGTQADADPELSYAHCLMAIERISQMLGHAIAVVPALSGLAPAASALAMNVLAARTALTPPMIFPGKPDPVAETEAEIAADRAKFEADAAEKREAARVEAEKVAAAQAEADAKAQAEADHPAPQPGADGAPIAY